MGSHLLPLYLACALTAMFCGTLTGYMLMEKSPRFRACAIRVLRADRWVR